MKKQTKIAMKLSVIAMIVSAFMMLAACTETVQKQKIPGATYMGGNNTITEICKELDSAGAAHVDIFREWAVDFADSAGKNAKRISVNVWMAGNRIMIIQMRTVE